jgi:hypothetical protein
MRNRWVISQEELTFWDAENPAVREYRRWRSNHQAATDLDSSRVACCRSSCLLLKLKKGLLKYVDGFRISEIRVSVKDALIPRNTSTRRYPSLYPCSVDEAQTGYLIITTSSGVGETRAR